MSATESIATYARNTWTTGCFHQYLTTVKRIGYTPAVSSKKGLIGIGVPMHRCDESRSFCSADHAASLSVPPVMAARMGGRKARRFAQAVPGTPTCSSCRPQLALGAAVVANRTAWRPHMARLIRRDYRPGTAPFTQLPFVADVKVAPRKMRRSFWNVPQTDDYGHANTVGRQYACDLLQFLKDNPLWVGSNTIGTLVADMAACPKGTAMRGYEVGFWSALEVILFRAVNQEDHWRVIQAVQDRYDTVNAAREIEAANEALAA